MIRKCIFCKHLVFSFTPVCKSCAANIIQEAIQKNEAHSSISYCPSCGVNLCEGPSESSDALLTVLVFNDGCNKCKREKEPKTPSYCLFINK